MHVNIKLKVVNDDEIRINTQQNPTSKGSDNKRKYFHLL